MVKQHSIINSKKIAKNTLYMYVRMFLILGITLYTARVIIRTLGIDDYGIYNIVGGIVILFSFVNTSLKNAFQRFISFELGRGDEKKIHSVIGSCNVVIVFFSLLFLLFAETIGVWFVNNKLNIPFLRLNAANWVYQLSIISFIINLFQTPYQAAVISYEKFSFYAIYSIVEVLLKLFIAYLIVTFNGDKLIIYSGLITFVNLINVFCISIYTNKYLKVPFKIKNDTIIFKSIFSYSGWAMVNSSTVLISQQGGNILLNIFNGILANGAYGIANQVSAAVYGFVANFQSTFNPQIVKSYASEEYENMYKLINRCCLFSFYLLLIIVVPFLLKCDYIIQLWLGENPPFASGFCRLMLIYFLIDAAQAPLWMLIYATGKVKTYQIWSGAITILNLPIAALLLYYGFSIYWVFITRILLNILCSIIRPIYLKHLVDSFSIRNYLTNCIIPITKTIFVLLVTICIVNLLITIPSLLQIILSAIITFISIWMVGISSNDKKILINFAKKKIK